MTDAEIIQKYFERSEEAIAMTRTKYGSLCKSVARNILTSYEDAEECVSDTYFRAWNTIPPQRPNLLSAFLCKITRNLALDRYRRNSTSKRGKGNVDVILEELETCVEASTYQTMESEITEKLTIDHLIEGFLITLNPDDRKIFVNRYFFMSPVKEIAGKYHIGQSKVKMSLLRSRERLRDLLEEEGYLV